MSTLTRRGASANQPAKLPSLQGSRAADPNVQRALEAIREWLEVRLGARGDAFERAVTRRELVQDLDALIVRIAALEAASGTGTAATAGSSSAGIDELSAALNSLKAAMLKADAEMSAAILALQSQLASGAGTGDFSTSTASSVDSEIVLFSGTGGKTGKRSTGTGFAKLTSGVLSVDSVNTVRATLGEKVQALTDGATISVDASLGNNCRVTLGGNRTLANPTNLIDGQVLNFRIKQDGTGSRTLAYGSKYKFPDGAAPVLSTTAGALDFMSCEYDVTDDTLVCVLSKAFG